MNDWSHWFILQKYGTQIGNNCWNIHMGECFSASGQSEHLQPCTCRRHWCKLRFARQKVKIVRSRNDIYLFITNNIFFLFIFYFFVFSGINKLPLDPSNSEWFQNTKYVLNIKLFPELEWHSTLLRTRRASSSLSLLLLIFLRPKSLLLLLIPGHWHNISANCGGCSAGLLRLKQGLT